MAYTPINWQTGDTITAEKLNKCDNGWSVESSSTELCSESVTTAVGDMGLPEAVLSYSAEITADSIIVTLNGTDYTCPKKFFSETYFYGGFDTDNGAPDFSTYPFFLWSNVNSGTNTIYTENAGSYTVVIGILTTTTEVSDNFTTASQTAVADALPLPLKIVLNETTFAEVEEALKSGRQVIHINDSSQNRTWQEPVIFATRSTTPLRVAFVSCDNAGTSLSLSGFSADSVDGVLYE